MVIFFLYKTPFCALKKNCVEREQPSYKTLSIEARSALYPVVVALKKTIWLGQDGQDATSCGRIRYDCNRTKRPILGWEIYSFLEETF